MKVRSLQEASRRFTKGAFTAYLENKPNCTENWLKGMIRASSPDAVEEALYSLSFYGNRERFDALRRVCEVA